MPTLCREHYALLVGVKVNEFLSQSRLQHRLLNLLKRGKVIHKEEPDLYRDGRIGSSRGLAIGFSKDQITDLRRVLTIARSP